MDKITYKFFCLLIIFFITSPTSADARSYGYDSLLNVTEFTFESSIRSGNRTIVYHGISQYRGENILREASQMISLLPEFYPNLDKQCKFTDLHIYQIDHDTLNNREVMSFLPWHLWGNLNIKGAYDSISSPRGTAAIFITSRDSGSRETRLVSHEITHYWQDTMCKKVNETQAYDFEVFYRERTR